MFTSAVYQFEVCATDELNMLVANVWEVGRRARLVMGGERVCCQLKTAVADHVCGSLSMQATDTTLGSCLCLEWQGMHSLSCVDSRS